MEGRAQKRSLKPIPYSGLTRLGTLLAVTVDVDRFRTYRLTPPYVAVTSLVIMHNWFRTA